VSRISPAVRPQTALDTLQWTWNTPPRPWVPLDLRALWAYRELLYFLAWRDIKVRYKQTVFGVAWAIIQPLAMMVVFSVFLGRLAGVPSDGVPYPIFVYCGLVVWQAFSQSLATATGSVVASANLVTKVYFPRLVIPIAAVAVGLVDALIGSVVLILLLVYYHVGITPAILTLPAFLLLAVLTALAAGVWLAALNVQYRDVRHAVPFLIQLWLFATPVVYPSSLVPENWRPLLALNPVTGVVEGFRWALLGQAPPALPLLAVSTGATLIVLVGGLFYFRRMEQTFADAI